jgi:hypothetical protein
MRAIAWSFCLAILILVGEGAALAGQCQGVDEECRICQKIPGSQAATCRQPGPGKTGYCGCNDEDGCVDGATACSISGPMPAPSAISGKGIEQRIALLPRLPWEVTATSCPALGGAEVWNTADVR